MGDGLHIKVTGGNANQVSFDRAFGCLVLRRDGSFPITVKEYDEEKKLIDDRFNSDVASATRKWNERSGWTAQRRLANWNANEAERNERKSAALKILYETYANVNWVWTVAPSQLDGSQLSHNAAFDRGIPKNGLMSVNFQKVLEGGGLAYLEAFLPNEAAKASKPFGIFVQAIGTPKIHRVEWTDFIYNPLKNITVAYRSEVLLHIYTEALYGQELEIYLVDEDLLNNDDLNIANKPYFRREVGIHKMHPKEIGKDQISGGLVATEQDFTDSDTEKEDYLQKITIEVLVDYSWMSLAGPQLKIFPKIKSLKTGEYFEDFTKDYLKVDTDGTLYTVEKVVTNMPVVQSNISTNVADNHPCQYTVINYINKDNEIIPIFTEESGTEGNAQIKLGIIAGSTPVNFTFNVDENASTIECNFDDTPNDHDLNIFTYDRRTRPSNVYITTQVPKSISGNATFHYAFLMIQYFWLTCNYSSSRKYSHLIVAAKSCRHIKNIGITVLPDIEWELVFLITMTAGLRIKANSTEYEYTKFGIDKYKFKGIDVNSTGDIRRKGGLGYSLVIKYAINGGQFINQMNFDFVKNIERVIDTFNKIYEWTSIFKSDVSQTSSIAIQKGVIKKLTFDIEPPSVQFFLKWKYDYAKRNKQVVVQFTGGAGFRPLIGFKITVDLVPLLGYAGPVGRITRWIIDKLQEFYEIDLYILAEAGMAIRYDEGLSYNEVDGFDPDVTTKIIVDVVFGFKAGLKKKDTILITATQRMQGNTIPVDEVERETFKIEGAVTTGVRYTKEKGFEVGKGDYSSTKVEWLGAEMTIVIVSLSNKRKINSPENFQFRDRFNLLDRFTIKEPVREYTQQ